MAVLLESAIDAGVRVVSLLDMQALNESSDSRWRRFGRSYFPQRLSESLTVVLTMSRAAKLTISDEPEWTDFFTAEQTAQSFLANLFRGTANDYSLR
jgi:hypothetical protein